MQVQVYCTSADEVHGIAQQIDRLLRGEAVSAEQAVTSDNALKISAGEIAVLCRTARQEREIEAALVRQGVPCCVQARVRTTVCSGRCVRGVCA